MSPVERASPGGDEAVQPDGSREDANRYWQFERSFVSGEGAIRDVLAAVRTFLSERAMAPTGHGAVERVAERTNGGAELGETLQRRAPQGGGCNAVVTMELAGRVEIVLAEALNNIEEHAYAGLGEGPITICLRVDRSGVQVRIVDRGAPMPGERLPQGRLPSTDVELGRLPEGGFGWYLIHSQTDAVIYDRANGENRLQLVFAAPPVE